MRLIVAGIQRVFKEKIRTTATLGKVFRTMELAAASRIGRTREAAGGLDPYAQVLTRSIAVVALHDHELNHPMLIHHGGADRIAVLVVTSDRRMADAHSSSTLRETDGLVGKLRTEDREPVLYVNGRRGESYYGFQGVEVAKSWTGKSDNPDVDASDDVVSALLDAYLAAPEDGDVDEFIVIHARLVSMVRQTVRVRHMFPLEVIEAEDDDEREPVDDLGGRPEEARPLFELEPSTENIFDALLPMYVNRRIHSILLMAAAPELASRQQAMYSTTENAQEFIEDYTRLANNARQAEITTEITEIISSADTLRQGA